MHFPQKPSQVPLDTKLPADTRAFQLTRVT